MPPTAKTSDDLAKAVNAALDAQFGGKKKSSIGGILAVLMPIIVQIIQAWLESKQAKPAK